MNASKQCQMYYSHLMHHHSDQLAIISDDNVDLIAYMLAGSICFSEHKHDYKIMPSELVSVASFAVNTLVYKQQLSPVCKQIPLAVTAVIRYREHAIPHLGGYQTQCTASASEPLSVPTQTEDISGAKPLAKWLAKARKYFVKTVSVLLLAMIAAGVWLL